MIFNLKYFFSLGLCLLLLINTPGLAQANKFDLAWEKYLTSNQSYVGVQSFPTKDGALLVLGEQQSAMGYTASKTDIVLTKLDQQGLFKWRKVYGCSEDDRGYWVRETEDGGFIIAGTCHSNFPSTDQNACIIKVDDKGQKLWHKTYGGSGEETGKAVLPTFDGGYLLVGDTNSSGAGDMDIYLVKTNTQGRVEWQKTYGGKSIDLGSFVLPQADGYLVVGQTLSLGAGQSDIYLVKTDDRGNQQWAKTFGGDGWEQVHDIKPTSDGGYLLVGQSSSFNQWIADLYCLKIDAEGNKQWEKAFSGNGWAIGKSVQEVPGGYLLAGWTNDKKGAGYELYLVNINHQGDVLGEQQIKNSKFTHDFALQATGAGEIVITGWYTETAKWTELGNYKCQVYLAKYTN